MSESSFTKKYGTSFTDVPGQQGFVGDIPELQWGRYAPQEAPEQEQFPMPQPPESFEGYLAPDYSDRNLFEQHVLRELGRNPFELNPLDAVTVADENLPELFHHFFGGRVTWNDRSKLTKEQADAWNEVVRSYHAWVFESANMEKAVLTDRYNFMMNQFDNAARQYEANVNRIRSEREKFIQKEEAGKRAAAKAAADKLKAAKPSKVKAADLNAYQKQFGEIQTQFSEQGDVSRPSLDAFNSFAKEHALPELEVIESEGGTETQRVKKYKGWSWLPDWVRDMLAPDELKKMKLQVKEAKKGTAEKAKKKRGGASGTWAEKSHGKIVRRGKTKDGKRVVQYEDGFIGYE